YADSSNTTSAPLPSLRQALELLTQHLDVLAHLVRNRVGALVGGQRTRVFAVERRLLRVADRPVMVSLGHRRLGGRELVLRRPEFDRRAGGRAHLLGLLDRALRVRHLRAGERPVAGASGDRQRCERETDNTTAKELSRLVVHADLLHSRGSID